MAKNQNKPARSGTTSELLSKTWKVYSHTVIIIRIQLYIKVIKDVFELWSTSLQPPLPSLS